MVWVLITSKAFANASIAKKLLNISGKNAVVLLQNGFHVEAAFEHFSSVYRCVLFASSQRVDKQSVNFKLVSSSPVGDPRGNNLELDGIIESMTTPQFEFHFEPNINRYIWEKVIINCAFNSICPLL